MIIYHLPPIKGTRNKPLIVVWILKDNGFSERLEIPGHVLQILRLQYTYLMQNNMGSEHGVWHFTMMGIVQTARISSTLPKVGYVTSTVSRT